MMRRRTKLAALVLVAVFGATPVTTVLADYSAEDCALVEGTLSMHWRGVSGTAAPCTTIVNTNGSYDDAEDAFLTFDSTASTDGACKGLSHYEFFLTADGALTGYDTTNVIPMFLIRSEDGKCFHGHWRSGAEDYVVHLSTDAFEGASAPYCGDVDENRTVAASDALLVLRKAVDQPVELVCSADFHVESCTGYFAMAVSDLIHANSLLLEGAGNKCGDGEINVAGEHCDGDALGGATCETLDPLGYGTLACGDDCKFDASGCGSCQGGAVHEGLCWYQGEWGENCIEACAAHGLDFDEATFELMPIGDEAGASAQLCADISALLPLPSDEFGCGFAGGALLGGGPAYADHAGCTADRGGCIDGGIIKEKINRSYFDASATLTAEAKDPAISRVCACKP